MGVNGWYYRVDPGKSNAPPRSWRSDYFSFTAYKVWLEATKGRRWYEKSDGGPYIAFRYNSWSLRGGLRPNGGWYWVERQYYHNSPLSVPWPGHDIQVSVIGRHTQGQEEDPSLSDTDIPSETRWQIYPNGQGSKLPVPKVEVFDS